VRAANIYSDGRRLAHLGLASVDSSYNFALDLAQDETERILGEYLESFGVRVERQVELVGFTQDADVVTATLSHAGGREETVTMTWLLGCYRAHSTVRHTLGLPFEGAPYPRVRRSWRRRYAGSCPPTSGICSWDPPGLSRPSRCATATGA
jgi:2-polyprenyl-6-methoxyphenol hydroxylase-like FAD-dependent oxidoreductase